MKYIILLLSLCMLVGCNLQTLPPVAPEQSFVATLNIDEPSIQYFDEDGELLTTWALEEYYTGAVLLDEQRLFLYSHALPTAVVYELETGKLIDKWTVDAGTTNALYDAVNAQVILTNEQTNTVRFYALDGTERAQVPVRNYPMAMAMYNNYAYIINYKDTWLSVIDMTTQQVVTEWPIAAYSNGIMIDEKAQEVWVGGHGEGTESNTLVHVYDLQTGKERQIIPAPLMPVNIAMSPTQKAVISHGNNALYFIEDYEVIQKLTVGANPFAVSYWQKQWLVAGYDDQILYFIDDNAITKKVETEKGPFQLIVRD